MGKRIKKSETPPATVTPKAETPKQATKCQALEVGHRRCKCGGKYCQQPDAE